MKNRAFLAVVVALVWVASASASDTQKYRLAAINYMEHGSKVLVEDPDGVQRWFKVGDSIGLAEIVRIEIDRVTLSEAGVQSVLSLRRSRRLLAASNVETQAPASEISKGYQYVGLMSELEANDARPGESQAASDARVMNRVFGLADKARITAVDRVEVSTAAEARAELQQRLTTSDPIRITIEGDVVKVLYVVPN